ncbi:MAG: ABC transporter permease [Rhodospirillales bacterium]|nr:ABC transporter permease [Rhodospirillales bacterium]
MSAHISLIDRLRRNRVIREHGGSVALSLPTVIFLLILFAVPVVQLMLLSFQSGTFEHYEKAFTDELYVTVLLNTFEIALLVTVISFFLAYPLAYFLIVAQPLWRNIGMFCLLMPFWTSILVRTYAWMAILGRRGIINEALLSLGIIDAPLSLLYNTSSVLIGMVHVLMPYMVFPLYAVMRRVDPNLMQAAYGLGAPNWRAFLRVYFPMTMPGVLAGASLVFILSMGFFITPVLLGGGRVTMIAVLIEQFVTELLDWEFAGALSMALLTFTLVVYSIFKRLMKSERNLA